MLGEKLGPMVFQFPYFNEDVFNSPVQFLDRLKVFFKKLPQTGHKFAIGIRNKWWLTERFADLLKENKVALVLQDHSLMPSAERVFSTIDSPHGRLRVYPFAWRSQSNRGQDYSLESGCRRQNCQHDFVG